MWITLNTSVTYVCPVSGNSVEGRLRSKTSGNQWLQRTELILDDWVEKVLDVVGEPGTSGAGGRRGPLLK